MIPRENDIVRLYMQQSENHDLIDPTTGRVDKDRTSPEKLLEEVGKVIKPYSIDTESAKINWWTVYVSK